MDEKKFKHESEEYAKAKNKMIQDKQNSDRATHSENKTWNVDYKTGTLK